MQNTMVRGGGLASWGKKYELGEKGDRKKEENYIKKKGEKALKMHIFGLRSARRKLICRGKKRISREGPGDGDDQNAQYISMKNK